jgi:hypothetical protein
MIKKLFFRSSILALGLIHFLSGQMAKAQTLSFAKFSIGESRVKLNLNDFLIQHQNGKSVSLKLRTETIQWIRNENNLLTPRALLEIKIKSDTPDVTISYLNKMIVPVSTLENKTELSTSVYVDLFNPGEVKISKNNTIFDIITIHSKKQNLKMTSQLIDYSCAPYRLQVTGVDNEFISVGCKMDKLGTFLHQTPKLEVTLSSTNLKSANNDFPPFNFYLTESSQTKMLVKDGNNELKTIQIEATLPKRLHRMKMALGLGPYVYESSYQALSAKGQLAPSAIMLYGKFDFTDTSSIRAFDALLVGKSFFNNSGLYLSYDLAEAFDGRILMNTLLGFQGLHYNYSKEKPTEFNMIYPQGFEVIYKHAFGIQNYHLYYGMFLSTNSETYTNAWIRYGSKYFVELNYIDWGHGDSKMKMLGLSVGLPIFEAF